MMKKKIEKFYVDNRSRLVNIVYNRVGGAAQAEDVVQDAFERALRYNRSFEPDKQLLGAWFNTILSNALRDFQRSERLMGMSVEYVEEMDEAAPMLEWEGNMLDIVQDEIKARSVFVRQALFLYFFKQYKPREIAQILDISSNYISVCVNQFKKEMADKYGGGLCVTD